MTTVSHKDLTGANLHEPKGADTAASGQVYVADGVGSGTWTDGDQLLGGSTFGKSLVSAADATAAKTLLGISTPTTSTLPVGYAGLMVLTSGTVTDGSTKAGTGLRIFAGYSFSTQFNDLEINTDGATQTGTWKNISGATADTTAPALFVRIS